MLVVDWASSLGRFHKELVDGLAFASSVHLSESHVATTILALTILVMFIAVLFNFTNGFHDAGNSTAIVVATKSLRPLPAVLLAAVFNFLPLFFASNDVADTVAKTVNADAYFSKDTNDGIPYGLFLTWSALISAIFWNYFTWHLALPSSSSHALIGGLIGAGLALGGSAAINWIVVRDILISIVASPAIAFSAACLAILLIRLILNCFRRRWPKPPFNYETIDASEAGGSESSIGIVTASVDDTADATDDNSKDGGDVDASDEHSGDGQHSAADLEGSKDEQQSTFGDAYDEHVVFRVLLLLFSILLSYGHGANDAQKCFGLMATALVAGGYLPGSNSTSSIVNGTAVVGGGQAGGSLPIPIWVKLLAFSAITLGTLFGGWSIIKTLGMSITKITRASGVAANLGAVVAVNGATVAGIPISTTHAITSAIVGSGVGQRQPVTWSVVGKMVGAWVTTLPCVTLIGFVVMWASLLETRWLAYTFDALVLLGLLTYAIVLSVRAKAAYKDIEVSLSESNVNVPREELDNDDDNDDDQQFSDSEHNHFAEPPDLEDQGEGTYKSESR